MVSMLLFLSLILFYTMHNNGINGYLARVQYSEMGSLVTVASSSIIPAEVSQDINVIYISKY